MIASDDLRQIKAHRVKLSHSASTGGREHVTHRRR